jgi:hypothetical protein
VPYGQRAVPGERTARAQRWNNHITSCVLYHAACTCSSTFLHVCPPCYFISVLTNARLTRSMDATSVPGCVLRDILRHDITAIPCAQHAYTVHSTTVGFRPIRYMCCSDELDQSALRDRGVKGLPKYRVCISVTPPVNGVIDGAPIWVALAKGTLLAVAAGDKGLRQGAEQVDDPRAKVCCHAPYHLVLSVPRDSQQPRAFMLLLKSVHGQMHCSAGDQAKHTSMQLLYITRGCIHQ